MNKTAFLAKLSQDLGVQPAVVNRFLNAFTAAVGDVLQKEDKLRLTGFLTFSVRDVEESMARNPQNGKMVKIKPHSRVSVKPGKALRSTIKHRK